MVHFDYRPKTFRQIGVNDHIIWISKMAVAAALGELSGVLTTVIV